MSIPLRIQIENGMYHIIVRGNNKQDIFINPEDYTFFLKILEQACKKFKITIYTYCLMSNYYHLHIETKEANLVKFMHWLNTEYVININFKYKRTGHLFEGRYKSILVDKDTYCLSLNRYIHLNPVNAGLVKYPGDYLWSSYSSYLRGHPLIQGLNINFLFDYFGKNKNRAIVNYKEYIYEGLNFKQDSIAERIKGELILGNDDFLKRIETKIGKNKINTDLYTQIRKLRRKKKYE